MIAKSLFVTSACSGSRVRYSRSSYLRLLPLLFVLVLPVLGSAEFNYTTNQGSIIITKYTGLGGNVIIPSAINDLPVTSIGASAFYMSTDLTSVTIPDSVNNLGSYAFWWCTNLANVEIGSSVTNIGHRSFYGCSKLANITFPDSVSNIGYEAFSYCTGLERITIPDRVTTISFRVFNSCSNLTSFIIPDSVTTIEDGAFLFCSSLTSVIIGKSVNRIVGTPFNVCRSLTAIDVDPLNSFFSSLDGVVFNKDQTLLIEYPEGKPGNYTIPDSVSTIGESAFSHCRSITNVTIPDRVTSIGGRAFFICPSLTNVYFKGNAPGSGTDVFIGSNHAIVYHLPGTTGWGPTFGDRATAFWYQPCPEILSIPPAFGIQKDQFGFRISWATNANVVIEASTELAKPNWTPVRTNSLSMGVDPDSDGWFYFSDPDWTNSSARFYRLRTP